MSAHPFRRLGRNTLSALLALPVRAGSTAAGRTLARASRAAMWPDDRGDLSEMLRARELQDAINAVITRRRWAAGGVVVPREPRRDRVSALVSPNVSVCTCRYETRVGNDLARRVYRCTTCEAGLGPDYDPARSAR